MTTQPAWTPEGTFPERLALIRNHHGWNVKEAALACGIARATWASWEAGKSPHNYVEVCRKIANNSGTDFNWLVSGSASTRWRSSLSRHPRGHLLSA